MKDLLYPLRVLHGRLHRRSRENRQLSEIKNRICTAEPDSVLFVLTPTHGNMGDHAIAAAVSDMLRLSSVPPVILRAKNTMVRYRKNMVKAEHMALQALIAAAACSGPVKKVNVFARICHTGFPGGWPTSSLYDDAMYSPQSQNETVGSMVRR